MRAAELNAVYRRHRGRNFDEFKRQEGLLRDARAWAMAGLQKHASEVKDLVELRHRVVKEAWDDFVPQHKHYADFQLGYLEFESALWQEGSPSVGDFAIKALAQRTKSETAKRNSNGTKSKILAPKPKRTKDAAKGGRPRAVAIFGEKLIELRGDLSQKTFGRLTKLSIDVIQRAEQGEATVRTIQKICRHAKSRKFELTPGTLRRNPPLKAAKT